MTDCKQQTDRNINLFSVCLLSLQTARYLTSNLLYILDGDTREMTKEMCQSVDSSDDVGRFNLVSSPLVRSVSIVCETCRDQPEHGRYVTNYPQVSSVWLTVMWPAGVVCVYTDR